jgi:hypothetical protein
LAGGPELCRETCILTETFRKQAHHIRQPGSRELFEAGPLRGWPRTIYEVADTSIDPRAQGDLQTVLFCFALKR